MTNYHSTQWLSLLSSYLRTKLFFPRRINSFPTDIRNRKYMHFGKHLVTGRYNRIECYKVFADKNPNLVIGDDVQIMIDVTLHV